MESAQSLDLDLTLSNVKLISRLLFQDSASKQKNAFSSGSGRVDLQ